MKNFSPAANFPQSCTQCVLESFCHLKTSASIFTQDEKWYQPGDTVIKEKASFKRLYLIKEGAAKSIHVLSSGKEQVVSFYLPGEIIGFEGLAKKVYPHTTVALSPMLVCEIPYEFLLLQISDSFSLQTLILQVVHESLDHSFNHYYSSQVPAPQRMAHFLIDIVTRLNKTGHTLPYSLPMQRTDIANFLGITPETVSRCLRGFQKEERLRLVRRSLMAIDMGKLRELDS